jgi:hypothetical protein
VTEPGRPGRARAPGNWGNEVVATNANAIRGMCTALAALTLGILPGAGAAHELPNDVRVQAFLKPAGEHLQLLVRVPLGAMQDVDFPRRGPGYLDLTRADAALRTAAAQWIADNLTLYEGETRLPYPRLVEARVSLPSDKSFVSYEQALAHLTGPRLPDTLELYWEQGLLDVLFDYPIRSERAELSLDPRFARLGLQVLTLLHFLPAGGAERVLELHGNPGLVRLDPRWYQSASRFIESGFLHILGGNDHLLFILCLVIPLRRFRTLALVVTAFTVSHSITLIAAAFGYAPGGLWFPPLVETLIALSIVYMALENIVGGGAHRRWLIAFAFGLVHGFGFSFALRETLQFAGSHLLTSLLAFNVGVELGQLLVLVAFIPLLNLVFRFLAAERIGTIVASALVAHTGWHWMLERAERLAKFPWPSVDAASLAAALRWLIALLALAGFVWLARSALRRREEQVRRRAG